MFIEQKSKTINGIRSTMMMMINESKVLFLSELISLMYRKREPETVILNLHLITCPIAVIPLAKKRTTGNNLSRNEPNFWINLCHIQSSAANLRVRVTRGDGGAHTILRYRSEESSYLHNTSTFCDRGF